MPGFFTKQRITASVGYNRGMVPPSALSVHLCIGQAYAFRVFNDPLTRVIGITESTSNDWRLTTLGWVFSLAIVFLGLSAAFGGKWLEKVGPRLTIFVSACCFGGGFWISALGVYLHEIWLIYLGYGVIGGIGLGLGYVSPVSTLAEEQARRGHEVWLYYVRKPPGVLEAAPDPALVKTRVFSMSLPLDHPGFSVGFAASIARDIRQFDIVHIQPVRNFVTWWAMWFAAKAGVPFIVAPQGSYEDWVLKGSSLKNRVYDRLLEVPWLNGVARIQCLTEREVEQVGEMGIKAQCVVIPNGVNVEGAGSGEKRAKSKEDTARSGESYCQHRAERMLPMKNPSPCPQSMMNSEVWNLFSE